MSTNGNLDALLESLFSGNESLRGGRPDQPEIRPATLREASFLIEGAKYQPAVGDTVTLRPKAKDFDPFITAEYGDKYVVTQVLQRPYRGDFDPRSAMAAESRNIAVAMVAKTDSQVEHLPVGTPMLVEFLLDSRLYCRVETVESE